ncbi:MAG: hypothetical protein R3B70_14420 [Polyangiaceae bacterium]
MSEVRFFLIAAALHAVLPVAAIVAPRELLEETAAPIEVDLELEVQPTGPPPEPLIAPAVRVDPTPVEEAPATRTDARPSVANVPGTGMIDPGPAPTSAPSVEPGPTGPGPAPTGTGEYSGPPPMVMTGPNTGLAGLGMGGPAWSMPGVVPDMGKPAPAPTTSPRATVDPQVATRVLTEAVKEKDKALGLDLPAGGTVASSVRGVVQAVNTPPESRATFEVKLSPTGQVVSVRVTSSSGGTTDMWSSAAKQVKAALAGRALAMTSAYSKGATVYVNVQTVLALPSGGKSAIERKGVGAEFDVSNLGAHMQRVVKSSFSVVAVK